ncbi:MAG: hypothetical protein COA78_30080 [Blastopirellula sp.]|nr:MAG: hypothetical protein COA78_30080 [Blastopirellula sp.]
MTGRHCRNVAFHTNPPPSDLISRETLTMANVFAANGYRTGIFGKWHLGDYYPHRAIDRGFQEAVVHGGGAITTVGDIWGNDYFDDRYFHNGKKTQYKGFCTDVWFNEATRFILESQAKGKPFFCYLPTNIPHGPHYAHEEYAKRFEGKPHPQLFAALAHFDNRVGEMRSMLRDNGLAENTIFIYCTDNGSPRSYAGGIFNAGMTGGKGSSYEGGHRVPCFIHWPTGKLTGGRDVNQLSAHLDILPTLVDLCRLQTPKNYQTDGISLKPVLDSVTNNLGPRVLVESFKGTVMTKRWRLMRDPRSKKHPELDGQLLYDMSADPSQQNDVAQEHPEVVSRLNVVLERVNAKNDNRQQRYIIGSDEQNPVEFSPSSWSERISTWQKGIRIGTPGAVPIFAEVEIPGIYRFSLRRWPVEMDTPIRSAPELTVPDGFEGKTKTEKGMALPIVKARLKVPGFEKTIEVTDDMTEAVFTVSLKKGDCDILAEFFADDGKEYGAYFLSVERKGATETAQAKKPAKRSAALATDKWPNIVFLMSDDHKASAMGCMGNQEIETPYLDRLAGKGVLFERCYATSPLCNPSRATTMTGMYEYKTGANFSIGPLDSKDWVELSYPMLLKEAGYRTAFAGKWGFNLDDRNYIDDFDAWGGFDGSQQGSYVTKENSSLVGYSQEHPHVSRALGAFGADFIEASAKTGKPFCLSISFKTPHLPHKVIDPLDQGRYKGVTFPRPPSFGQAGQDLLPTQAKLGRQYLLRKAWGADQFQDHLRSYYQLISGMDAAIGKILHSLEEAGIEDNTVVIYTSDNGYHCGEHGLQGKVLPYDSSALIPCIIYDPRSLSKGKHLRNSSVVGNIDFAPTILDLAGIEVPAKMDGVSLRPLIDDPSLRVRDKMLLIQNWGWMINDHNRGLAVVSEDWKYINWCYADENVPPAEELFHLTEDPGEMNNVISHPENREMLAKLQGAYDQFLDTWSKECVESEDYMRLIKLFDRNLHWKEKHYQHIKTEGKGMSGFREIYKELTGKEYEAN